MIFIRILESLALLAAALYLWRRSASAKPRRGRDFTFLILALGLQFALYLLAESIILGFQGGDTPAEPTTSVLLGIGAIQILRALLLVWAVWSWLLAVRPRLVRSWRGILILLCLILATFIPKLTAVSVVLMVLPLWRLKWTAGVHGWGRVGLFVFLGLMAFFFLLGPDNAPTNGEGVQAVFDDDRSFTPLQVEAPQSSPALVQLMRPWSHAIRVMLLLLHMQVIIGFIHLLLAPVRLRGLSLKRRFTVAFAMYRFIPGTLAFIFTVMIVYMGIGLHRAGIARQMFEQSLDEGLRTAEFLLSSSSAPFDPGDAQRAIRSIDRWATHPNDHAFAVVRQLEWTTVGRDTTAGAEAKTEQWVARSPVSSDKTPAAILGSNFFADIPSDSAIGLVTAYGSLYLRAARVHHADGRDTGAEVFVLVDSLYVARIANKIQSDVRIDVSGSSITTGSGVSITLGDEEDPVEGETLRADSAFAVAAPFVRDSEHDDFWERTFYLSRAFITTGNWLVPIEDDVHIEAVQLRLYTSPRGLFESLTGSARSFAAQLFAIAILGTIGLLFLIVELSAVRTGRGIIKGIVTDVKGLSQAAKKFGEGDLQHRVDLSGTDEMGQLASTFNTMAANIEKHQGVLIEKERLEADLALARDIQQRMLPQDPPIIPGLDVAGLSIPSREVGGDLFYFLPLANGRLGLTIGDVSGKSVPAALLMSNVLAALKSEARIVEKEDEILDHLNHLIVEQVDPGTFITFFYGVVDPAEGLLRYACAGHNPPLIMRSSGEVEWLKEAGMPLGVVPQSTYEPMKAALEPGDVLILYSDGVTEAERSKPTHAGDEPPPEPDVFVWEEEFFDEHRLEAAVREARDRSAAEIITHIMDAIHTFTEGAEQSDDLTIVVVRVAP